MCAREKERQAAKAKVSRDENKPVLLYHAPALRGTAAIDARDSHAIQPCRHLPLDAFAHMRWRRRRE